MITVLGCWEDTWMDAEITETRIWRQTLAAFQVKRFVMWPDKTNGNQKTGRFDQYSDFKEALASLEGHKTYLMPKFTIDDYNLSGQNLKDFIHPENVSYIFGRTPDNLIEYIDFSDDNSFVYIDTPQKTDFFGHVAVGITLYDRTIKNGN